MQMALNWLRKPHRPSLPDKYEAFYLGRLLGHSGWAPVMIAGRADPLTPRLKERKGLPFDSHSNQRDLALPDNGAALHLHAD